jgi:hypothetical protein
VNETLCEQKCGGVDYIELKSAQIDNMTDFNVTAMLDVMDDMCGCVEFVNNILICRICVVLSNAQFNV